MRSESEKTKKNGGPSLSLGSGALRPPIAEDGRDLPRCRPRRRAAVAAKTVVGTGDLPPPDRPGWPAASGGVEGRRLLGPVRDDGGERSQAPRRVGKRLL